MPKGYVHITEDIKNPAKMGAYGKLRGARDGGRHALSFGPPVATERERTVSHFTAVK
jgi:hypothetical protein